MSKPTKIWLMTAVSLIILGLILFTVIIAVNHWDFTKLSTVKYETNTYTATRDFSNISVNSDTADIKFQLSDNDKCVIVCYEEENGKHSVYVQDDTLTIRLVNEKKWYEYIGITFSKPQITVYLPKLEYHTLTINENTGDVEIPKVFLFNKIDVHISTGEVKNFASATSHIQIKTTTGNINVKNVTTGGIHLSATTGKITAENIVCNYYFATEVSTGDCKIDNIKCKGFVSTGTTGDVVLNDVIAEEDMHIERDTGDIKFRNCDAATVLMTTSTGHITGRFLTSKTIIANTSTGRVNIPKMLYGGKCVLTTSTGDIKITIEK